MLCSSASASDVLAATALAALLQILLWYREPTFDSSMLHRNARREQASGAIEFVNLHQTAQFPEPPSLARKADGVLLE
jgi:hypothetical protein